MQGGGLLIDTGSVVAMSRCKSKGGSQVYIKPSPFSDPIVSPLPYDKSRGIGLPLGFFVVHRSP